MLHHPSHTTINRISLIPRWIRNGLSGFTRTLSRRNKNTPIPRQLATNHHSFASSVPETGSAAALNHIPFKEARTLLSAPRPIHLVTCGTVGSQPAPRPQCHSRTSPSAKSSSTTPTARIQMDMPLAFKKVSTAGAPTKTTRCRADNEHTWTPKENDESEQFL